MPSLDLGRARSGRNIHTLKTRLRRAQSAEAIVKITTAKNLEVYCRTCELFPHEIVFLLTYLVSLITR